MQSSCALRRRAARRLIVRRNNQRLYRVARAIVRDDSEAEDVLQEAYLSAFANLAKFRADASLATWLTRIVVNKAINRLRREDVVVPLEAVEHLGSQNQGRGQTALKSLDRSSEYPSDHFIGICIKAAAMAE